MENIRSRRGHYLQRSVANIVPVANARKSRHPNHPLAANPLITLETHPPATRWSTIQSRRSRRLILQRISRRIFLDTGDRCDPSSFHGVRVVGRFNRIRTAGKAIPDDPSFGPIEKLLSAASRHSSPHRRCSTNNPLPPGVG